MKIMTGTSRHVFVFKNIVIKVARVYFKSVIKNKKSSFLFWFNLLIKSGIKEYLLRKRKVRDFIKKQIEESEQDRKKDEIRQEMRIPKIKGYEYHSSLLFCFMGGVMANIQEWRFYRKTKHVFLMPTYFSFFGLFNIQKRGQEINFWKGHDVWHYIHQNVDNHEQPFCDGHTLAEICNYCLDDGHLKIVDYGSRRVEPFIEMNGQRLYDNFKLPE